MIFSIGRNATLISGANLAYLDGELEYFTGDAYRRRWGLSILKHPFFVVTGTNPATSVAEATGCDLQPTPRIYISNHNCVVGIMANWASSPAVLKFGICSEGTAELVRQLNGTVIAASDPEIAHLIPRVLVHKTSADGATILAQTRMLGSTQQFSWPYIDVAAELWINRKPAGNGHVSVRMGQKLAFVCQAFPRFRDLLEPPADSLLEWCESTRLPAGVTHGDFWLGNVIFKDNKISGIFDWEWAQKEGLLEVDGLHLLLMSLAQASGCHVAYYLRQVWADELEDSELFDRITRLRRHSVLDRDDLKFVALVFWFDLLWQRAVLGKMLNPKWADEMILKTLPTITKWLNRHSKALRSEVIHR
ncbi:MAG: phosphotransferase [Terracidiphilus sp.]